MTATQTQTQPAPAQDALREQILDFLALIAEAGTVYHETGLTPRQLAGKLVAANRRCAELEKALETIDVLNRGTGWKDDIAKLIRAALVRKVTP